MIKIINGILGGGKTALAVSYVYSLVPNKIIHKPIIKDTDYDSEYKKVYTNISGFKGDDFYISVEFLNWNILDKCAQVLYFIMQQNLHIQNIDTELNSYFDQVADNISFEKLITDLDLTVIQSLHNEIIGFRFNRVLFAIDEFADYFKDKQAHLDKWFKYSRHLYQDMVLIQNDIGDIARCYKNDKTVQNYIQASDAANRFFPSLFKYAYHRKSTQPASGKPILKNVYIPKWIFSKYESGKKQTAFPVIYKYLVLLFLLLFIVAYLLIKILNKDDEILEKNNVVNENITIVASDIKEQKNINLSKRDKRLLACFKCSNDICLYQTDIYSLTRLESTIKHYDFKLSYKNDFNVYSEYCYFSDKAFFKQYEKKEINNISKKINFGKL